MTNYEKIKNMSVEELAELLNTYGCAKCAFEAGEGIYCYKASEQGCKEGIRIWLDSEIDNSGRKKNELQF